MGTAPQSQQQGWGQARSWAVCPAESSSLQRRPRESPSVLHDFRIVGKERDRVIFGKITEG